MTNKQRSLFTGTFRQKAQDYVIQVSLIIVSLLIALGVDRCNTTQQKKRALQEYYAAIARDLVEEEETNRMNLYDTEQDLQSLDRAIRLFRINQTDSLETGLQEFGKVLTRGVFRTFTPTTFDVMSGTGDVLLIKDLDIRSDLASVFSFRTKILEQDLISYDEQVRETAKELGQFVDYACFVQRQNLVNCLLDRAAFVQDPHNELIILRRQAQLRAFHLSLAIQQNQSVLAVINEQRGLSKPE